MLTVGSKSGPDVAGTTGATRRRHGPGPGSQPRIRDLMIDVDTAEPVGAPLSSPPVQWFDRPGEPRGEAGDLTGITYRWMLALTHDIAAAEHLTLDVFDRVQQPLDDWLLAQPTLTRLKILCVAVFVRHGRQGTSYNCAPSTALLGRPSSSV